MSLGLNMVTAPEWSQRETGPIRTALWRGGLRMEEFRVVRRTFRWFGALLLALGLVAGGLAFLGGTASAAPKSGDDTVTECNGAFRGTPEENITITGAPGSPVAAGDDIDLAVEWVTTDWDPGQDGNLDKVILCVRLNGELLDDLTQIDKPTANDGEWNPDVFDVPAGFGADDELCARVRLSGNPAADNPSTQKSEIVCWQGGEGEPSTFGFTVAKEVEPDTSDATFEFTIDCDPVALDADNNGDAGVSFDDGVATVVLGDGDSVTFDGLPEDTTCLVSEAVPNTSNWLTTINGKADEDRATEVAADGSTTTFVNTLVPYEYSCESPNGQGSTVQMRGATTDSRVTAADFSVDGGAAQAGTNDGGGKFSATASNVAPGDHTYTVTFKEAGTVRGSNECAFTVAAQSQDVPRNDDTQSAVLGVAVDAPVEAAPAVAAAVVPASAEVEGVTLARTGDSTTDELLYAAASLVVFGLAVLALTRKPEGAYYRI